MKEITGNIWDFQSNDYIVIPTNGEVNKYGNAVMGKGLAEDAKNRFHDLPKELAIKIKHYGNRVYIFRDYNLITFPTKWRWRDKSDLELIEASAQQLDHLRLALDAWDDDHKLIYLPQVGCGNGKLEWKDVKPILEKHLKGDRFIVVESK